MKIYLINKSQEKAQVKASQEESQEGNLKAQMFKKEIKFMAEGLETNKLSNKREAKGKINNLRRMTKKKMMIN